MWAYKESPEVLDGCPDILEMNKMGKTGITDGEAGNNKKGNMKTMLVKEIQKGRHNGGIGSDPRFRNVIRKGHTNGGHGKCLGGGYGSDV